jgi:ABC-type Na+ efflux pump permease subunit
MPVPGIPFAFPFAAPFDIVPLDLDWFAGPESAAIWVLLVAWSVGGVLAATLFALLSGSSLRDLAERAPLAPERIRAWWRGHQGMPFYR